MEREWRGRGTDAALFRVVDAGGQDLHSPLLIHHEGPVVGNGRHQPRWHVDCLQNGVLPQISAALYFYFEG